MHSLFPDIQFYLGIVCFYLPFGCCATWLWWGAVAGLSSHSHKEWAYLITIILIRLLAATPCQFLLFPHQLPTCNPFIVYTLGDRGPQRGRDLPRVTYHEVHFTPPDVSHRASHTRPPEAPPADHFFLPSSLDSHPTVSNSGAVSASPPPSVPGETLHLL